MHPKSTYPNVDGVHHGRLHALLTYVVMLLVGAFKTVAALHRLGEARATFHLCGSLKRTRYGENTPVAKREDCAYWILEDNFPKRSRLVYEQYRKPIGSSLGFSRDFDGAG